MTDAREEIEQRLDFLPPVAGVKFQTAAAESCE
jgi:hypothetical protein